MLPSKDKLTICMARAGKPRPKELESKEGADTALMVLEREKK